MVESWRRAVVHLSVTAWLICFGTLPSMRLRLAGLLFAMCMPLVAQTSPESLLMQHSAGTSRNPAAAPMSMLSMSAGSWMLHAHALAFLNHIDGSGSRGDKKTFSTNWFMGSAVRSFGGGALQLRTMLSLEPATISRRRYPELFQTGETAFGKQIIDGQHPHDFFMELAAEYAHRIGDAIGYVYVAPVGDPALGPVAFPHRSSAEELPQATLTHHTLDSTHISYNVITGGATWRSVTLEASAFHGHEPDERRWNIDGGRIDSWAARARFQPTPNIDLQVSHGRLTKPEAVEPGYQDRTTASISYTHGTWSTTAAWGRVYKEVHDRNLDGFVGESVVTFFDSQHLTGRVEVVDKDELFPHPILTRVPRPPLPVRVFRVRAYTLGYTADVIRGRWGRVGAGANFTRYDFPLILQGFYGESPRTVLVYLRARLGAPESHAHHHHGM
jgi:hypothetical protein